MGLGERPTDLRDERDELEAGNSLERLQALAEILALEGTGWGDGLELADLRPGYVPFDE